jgi:hypothetical protein
MTASLGAKQNNHKCGAYRKNQGFGMGSEWERQTPMEWKNSHKMGKVTIAACGKVGKQLPKWAK